MVQKSNHTQVLQHNNGAGMGANSIVMRRVCVDDDKFAAVLARNRRGMQMVSYLFQNQIICECGKVVGGIGTGGQTNKIVIRRPCTDDKIS